MFIVLLNLVKVNDSCTEFSNFSIVPKAKGHIMDKIYNRIENLCAARGVNITSMCKAAGVPRSALSDYKAGRIKSLSADKLQKIASYLDVSIDEILGTTTRKRGKRIPTDNPEWRHPYLLNKYLEGNITPEEKEELEDLQLLNRIAGYLDQLTEEGKQEAEKRVKELSEIPRYQAQPSTDGKDIPEE